MHKELEFETILPGSRVTALEHAGASSATSLKLLQDRNLLKKKYFIHIQNYKKKILILLILNKRQLKVLFYHWNFDRGFQIEPINIYLYIYR